MDFKWKEASGLLNKPHNLMHAVSPLHLWIHWHLLKLTLLIAHGCLKLHFVLGCSRYTLCWCLIHLPNISGWHSLWEAKCSVCFGCFGHCIDQYVSLFLLLYGCLAYYSLAQLSKCFVFLSRWCHDIGREQAANKPLLKTVFQVMLWVILWFNSYPTALFKLYCKWHVRH